MRLVIFYGLLLAVLLLAFRRGGKEEQAAALTCVAGTVLTVALGDALNIRFARLEITTFVIDLLVFLAFLVIAMRSSRFWPLWVAGLQLTTLIVHPLKLIQPDLMRFVFGAALAFWSYPILLLIGAAALRTRSIERWRSLRHLPDAA